jgi:RNA polymerase sigma-70 factor, ECF subfamily
MRVRDMDAQTEFNSEGLFDGRYRSFLETINELRPSLHRYCARMTGSVMDGEDIVQDSLFEAYRKLDKNDDSTSDDLAFLFFPRKESHELPVRF